MGQLRHGKALSRHRAEANVERTRSERRYSDRRLRPQS